MLEIQNLEVSYGSIKALHGVSLNVPEKSIVTLIGANGAGKSTTLRAISGLIKAQSGTVTYKGEDITNQPAHKIVARHLCHVPEGRMVFANLTVAENLRMGAYLRNDKAGIAADDVALDALAGDVTVTVQDIAIRGDAAHLVLVEDDPGVRTVVANGQDGLLVPEGDTPVAITSVATRPTGGTSHSARIVSTVAPARAPRNRRSVPVIARTSAGRRPEPSAPR